MKRLLFDIWCAWAIIWLGLCQWRDERHLSRHRDEVGT